MNWTAQEEKALSRKRVSGHKPVDLDKFVAWAVANVDRFLSIGGLILALAVLAYVLTGVMNDRFYSMELGKVAYAEAFREDLRDFCEQAIKDHKGKEMPSSIKETCGL